ncbi:hypothetical protein FQN52_002367 [Onygenales sp. PD_12]|nr:hypothetical protein FQN52_002367 [Onygenales sp. PD_12]
MSEVSIKPESAEEPAEDVPVFKIARDGDVAFEVFLGTAKTKIHVLVSSHRLSAASTVFNAMFNSNFREGVGRTRANAGSGKPFVVPLPEDDAMAIVLLCGIIHGKVNDVVETNSSVSELYSLAILGDKYACTERLSYWMAIGLGVKSLLPGRHNIQDIWTLLRVAYIQNDSCAFERLSAEILTRHPGTILDLPELAEHGLVHHNILGAFQVKREKALLRLHACIERFLEEILCHGQNDQVLHYLNQLRKIGLFPLAAAHQHRSISSILESISNLELPNPKIMSIRVRWITENLSATMQENLGLCLICIKMDGYSGFENKCSRHAPK